MPKKILVIDDESEMVTLIKSRLEANNYEVIFAFDGDDGLLMAKNENPDLIILDILMPGVDGYTFVLEMKKTEKIKDIPVIILTAKDKLEDLFKFEGVKDYLVKPFESEELLSRIKEKLGE